MRASGEFVVREVDGGHLSAAIPACGGHHYPWTLDRSL
jgi:hypothetical protein